MKWWEGPTAPITVLHHVINLFTGLLDTVQTMVIGIGPKLMSVVGFDLLVTTMVLSGTLSTAVLCAVVFN